jgi:tetratricopeptide (TPR) repeat protein
MDYVVYAYLQKGENKLAKAQCNYMDTMKIVYPVNFKVAYAFAAIPSRYVLENKMWHEAASLNPHKIIPWQKFPWQMAIVHFTRSLGSVHLGNIDAARDELNKLNTIHDTLVAQKDPYRANQVQIQINTAKAWILFKEGKKQEALEMMKLAADMEDKTEKAPVTPGEVLPASELLADMLLEMNRPGEALLAYEEDLKKHPNRFNALYNAGAAAEKSKNTEKANKYYLQLTSIASVHQSDRPELEAAKSYLKSQKH